MPIVKKWIKNRTASPPSPFTGVDKFTLNLASGKVFVGARIRRLSGTPGSFAVVTAAPAAGSRGRIRIHVRWNVATFAPPGKIRYELCVEAKNATPSNITKSQRDLLLVSCVADYSIPRGSRWKNLYHWLDTTAVPLTRALLGPHYRKIHERIGNAAGYNAFLKALEAITARGGTKAVDVVLQLHGYGEPGTSGGKLSFADKTVKVRQIRKDILALGLSEKLRMLYSCACFGACHIDDFRKAGFRAVSGAEGVNTNSEFAYPATMTSWIANRTFRKCIDAGNNPVFVDLHDRIAADLGFTGNYEPNSNKLLGGKSSLRITSRP